MGVSRARRVGRNTLPKSDNLDDYLRLFAANEIFCYREMVARMPVTTLGEVIQLRPGPVQADTGKARGRKAQKVAQRA